MFFPCAPCHVAEFYLVPSGNAAKLELDHQFARTEKLLKLETDARKCLEEEKEHIQTERTLACFVLPCCPLTTLIDVCSFGIFANFFAVDACKERLVRLKEQHKDDMAAVTKALDDMTLVKHELEEKSMVQDV